MTRLGVSSLLNYLSSNIHKKFNNHSIIVALPLLIITIFCFGYALMQPAKILKKDETTAASKRPALFTGNPLPKINIPSSADDSTAQSLTPEPASSNLNTSPNNDQSSTPATSSPQTPITNNPQSAAVGSNNTNSYSKSNKASDLPLLKVHVSKTINNLLNNL